MAFTGASAELAVVTIEVACGGVRRAAALGWRRNQSQWLHEERSEHHRFGS